LLAKHSVLADKAFIPKFHRLFSTMRFMVGRYRYGKREIVAAANPNK
jgi:hypothetical protein